MRAIISHTFAILAALAMPLFSSVILAAEASPDPPPGMVRIPGGSFTMGGDAGLMDGGSASHRSAYPRHRVTVDGFWMDKTEVTNREFAAFVEATKYITFAEQRLPIAEVETLKRGAEAQIGRLEAALATANKKEVVKITREIDKIRRALEGLDGEAGSIIFALPEDELDDPWNYTQWWRIEPEANWRQPDGPGSSWKERLDHPVVNVTRADAQAYAKWAGKRLPTEAEWERAARGGLEGKPFVWGDRFQPDGEDRFRANTWQGVWPYDNSGADGFVTTAAVKRFPPNEYGLYDMAGNVWEITADFYHPDTYRMRVSNPINPTGPDPQLLRHHGLPPTMSVIRGGSFLCSDSWCSGYQPGSRQSMQADSPAQHIGFRCVRDLPVTE